VSDGKVVTVGEVTELERGPEVLADEPEIVGGTPVGHGRIPALLLWVIGFCVIVAGLSWISFRGY